MPCKRLEIQQNFEFKLFAEWPRWTSSPPSSSMPWTHQWRTLPCPSQVGPGRVSCWSARIEKSSLHSPYSLVTLIGEKVCEMKSCVLTHRVHVTVCPCSMSRIILLFMFVGFTNFRSRFIFYYFRKSPRILGKWSEAPTLSDVLWESFWWKVKDQRSEECIMLVHSLIVLLCVSLHYTHCVVVIHSSPSFRVCLVVAAGVFPFVSRGTKIEQCYQLYFWMCRILTIYWIILWSKNKIIARFSKPAFLSALLLSPCFSSFRQAKAGENIADWLGNVPCRMESSRSRFADGLLFVTSKKNAGSIALWQLLLFWK